MIVYFYKDNELVNTPDIPSDMKVIVDGNNSIKVDGAPVEVNGSVYQVTTKPLEVV
jgi:uncharacterized Zn-binding protein involved in type VI secretion